MVFKQSNSPYTSSIMSEDQQVLPDSYNGQHNDMKTPGRQDLPLTKQPPLNDLVEFLS
jgi:hypothetical protein